MSAFSDLFTEACERLRASQRRSVALHFDYEPDMHDGHRWCAWYRELDGRPRMFWGASGEQALRSLAESLRGDW